MPHNFNNLQKELNLLSKKEQFVKILQVNIFKLSSKNLTSAQMIHF